MKNLLTIFIALLLASCAPQNRMNMVKSNDGLLYGSVVEKNLFIDASQFDDNKIKVNIRNTSGDPTLNLSLLKSRIENALSNKGYEVVNKGFTIKFDINVTYSGHARTDLASSYNLLGGAAGGIVGYRSNARAGAAIGILTGATLGAIIGSYTTDDTYTTVTNVTIGILDKRYGKKKNRISFNSSPAMQEESSSGIRRFNEVLSNKVAVYAGGRNVSQQMIIDGVRNRLLSILVDII